MREYALARFIHFVPTEYYAYKTLRVEVYGVLLSTGTNSIFSVPYHWNPKCCKKVDENTYMTWRNAYAEENIANQDSGTQFYIW